MSTSIEGQPLRVAIAAAPSADLAPGGGSGAAAQAIMATLFDRGRLVVNVPPSEADVLVLVGPSTGDWGHDLKLEASAFADRIGPDRIIIVVDGAPAATTTIAQIGGSDLAAIFPEEPLWIDLRAAQDGAVTAIIRALDEERRRRRPPKLKPAADEPGDAATQILSTPAPPWYSPPTAGTVDESHARRGDEDPRQRRTSRARWRVAVVASVLLLLIAAWSTLTIPTAPDTGDTGGPNNVWPIVALIGGVLVIVSFLAYRVRRRSLRAASADREAKERARASSDAPTWPAPVRPAPPSLDSSFEPSVPDGRAVAFVSYATEDEHSVVRELVACLRSVVEVWFAPEDVGVGQQWLFAISDALENANFFVVVITKNSMSSPWVRQELSAAFRRSVESGSPLLVPVLAEPCDYPILLGNFQMIDATMLSREQTRERLVAAVG